MILTTLEATSGPMPSPGISVIRCVMETDISALYLNGSNEVPRSADVVIIGGGVIGLTIARALAQRGVREVCLIERAALGTEASFAAGGILAPQAEADGHDEFFELACRSRDLYAEFALALFEETGVDVELDTTGTLYVALNDADF